MNYTINHQGRLLSLAEPQVMGILNVTPDSFYAESRMQTEDAIAERARAIVNEGGTMIDIGGCSTRPGGRIATAEEEARRVRKGIEIVKDVLPDAIISIDTFRASVAKMAISLGADIINDISCGEDPEMFKTVADTGTPYILMSQRSNIPDMLLEFADKVEQLRALGQKDIILDPGFGFGKTQEENFQVLNEMDRLKVMELPLLVGVSRKRMIFRTLQTDPQGALNGTTVINTIGLMKGGDILRVHDVRPAVEAVKLYRATITQHS